MAFQQVLLFTISLLLSSWGSATAQGLPASLYGGGQQICNYQYAIPNGGNCVTYGPALERKLSAVQEDMNRLKLQYVTQNSLLQEELRKIRQQSAATDANVADVTKELKNLQGTVVALQNAVAKNTNNNNNGGGGWGGGTAPSTANTMLQQLVTTTRTQLTQDVLKLENKINTAFATLQADRQRDGIQQSRVDTAFQAQLRQQQLDLSTVNQKVQQLETRVTNLQLVTPGPNQPTSGPVATNAPTNAPTTSTTVRTNRPTTAPPQTPGVTSPPGPTTPNPLLVQLQKSLKQLDDRVVKLESNYTVDIANLQSSLKYMQELSKNESLQLSDVKTEVDYIDQTEIPQLKQRVDNNYNVLTLLNTKMQQEFNPLKDQVNKIAANVTSLSGQITNLGTRELNMQVKQNADEIKLNDLSLQMRLLGSRLTKFITATGITTQTPTTTTPPSTTTAKFLIPTPRSHG